MGVSAGGELALLAASLGPSLTRTVIGLVPNSRISFAADGRAPPWTVEGDELDPRDKIPVERIRGKVVAVGAGKDVVWYSRAYVNKIAETIEDGGRAGIEPLVYDEAGHAVGTPLPYMPGRPTNLTGGTPEADERARRELWPKILRALG